ncbi:3-hydroxyisobutyrate dehydrogenase [Pandoraea nosoerga]|uniref:3-hydroxyisobutyrate dehydrogenase n=1 Tax=Pandoraea nosoerga TaxID=2508296 RepID=A0A5E4T0E1_9BURK|nr:MULTISPECIES: 3-hydroxyisobutyrate dehydrogenase [Pandoraea]MBN4664377.1 3-hydroxyisobutyrate dehydrogenase [Pandoraea nosoerga]MBN4675727.1 3-hydroxyisobutyrate dehydrogenase [Pandoraea nosoerga]MBN4679466.1 3-hydroxyisobutyrate dehydrogenase [Pandoraea nosoerga]MBN4743537.1 3-hydroxyisobutyrate dehydrogenase [Pandoraea nosoerga]VVD81387.1 3-hydroxyisobutyrate dehydrogenase [Pandoraea nosoerga]
MASETQQGALRVAFIGLGNMGGPMAANLVRAGHAVRGFDLSAAALERLACAGGTVCASIADAVRDAQVVITMLPAGEHVLTAYSGEAGVLANAPADAVLIDSSTVPPEIPRQIATLARPGTLLLDAPVSGGTAGAAAGTLTFMVGGDAALVERMRPLLGSMGRAIHHGGPLGAGQTLKLCNNMLLGILMAGTSEALRLGIANGLDPKVLSAVMQQSSGRNWTLEVYNPCPGVMENAASSRGYTGGFATDLMAKDLRLAHGAAQASDVATPLGDLARRIFEVHRANGHGALDFSSIFQDPVTLAQALEVK